MVGSSLEFTNNCFNSSSALAFNTTMAANINLNFLANFIFQSIFKAALKSVLLSSILSAIKFFTEAISPLLVLFKVRTSKPIPRGCFFENSK